MLSFLLLKPSKNKWSTRELEEPKNRATLTLATLTDSSQAPPRGKDAWKRALTVRQNGHLRLLFIHLIY